MTSTFSENRLSMMKPFWSPPTPPLLPQAPSKHQTELSANISRFDPGSNILWRILEFSTVDYRVGGGLELWKGQKKGFTLPLPPYSRTCGECPAKETILRLMIKTWPGRIKPSTASPGSWSPICSLPRSQILVQTAMKIYWYLYQFLGWRKRVKKSLSYPNRPKGNGDYKGGTPLEDPLVNGRKNRHSASLKNEKF